MKPATSLCLARSAVGTRRCTRARPPTESATNNKPKNRPRTMLICVPSPLDLRQSYPLGERPVGSLRHLIGTPTRARASASLPDGPQDAQATVTSIEARAPPPNGPEDELSCPPSRRALSAKFGEP